MYNIYGIHRHTRTYTEAHLSQVTFKCDVMRVDSVAYRIKGRKNGVNANWRTADRNGIADLICTRQVTTVNPINLSAFAPWNRTVGVRRTAWHFPVAPFYRSIRQECRSIETPIPLVKQIYIYKASPHA